MRYYKITGLENGLPIEPFYVTDFDTETLLNMSYGDRSYHATEISKEEYLKQTKLYKLDSLKSMYKDNTISKDIYIMLLEELYKNEVSK